MVAHPDILLLKMNINKYRYLSSLLAGVTAVSVYAVPADPALKTIRQADGTFISVSIRGDEYGHAIYDCDGNRVEYDTATRMFLRVPSSGLRKGMPRPDKGLKRIKRTVYPTIGKQKSLVVLMQFSDQKFMSVSDPYDYYNRMLNEKGFTWSSGAAGSARDFYLASSDGKFDPDFVVAGPVTLPREATYYGGDVGTQDARMGEAIKAALDAVDAEVDFSEYDIDGDGIIDNIFFFYAGYGQADHPEGRDFIWPHSANAPEAWDIHLEYDGKAVGTYACSNEVRYSAAGVVEPTGIGTFVHEFGHVLGLADHYDTGYNRFAFGLDKWDTMASGSYNNNMHTPPLFSAFERAELGWMDYTDLDPESDTLQELPWIGCGEAKGYRVKVPGRENEWFVLENRQQTGWDEYLPGHGMLIWHVEMDEERWMANTVNNDSEHQLLDIVEVDGVGNDATRDSDTMPGTRNITSYALTGWDGNEVLAIDDVEESGEGADAIIRILMTDSRFSLDKPVARIVDLADETFGFTWSSVKDALYYTVTVNQDGKVIGGLDKSRYDTPEKVTVEGLTPESDFTVEVCAGRGSFLSETEQLDVTTEPLAFHKREVRGVSASPDGGNTIVLCWDAVRDADDYLVTLKHVTRQVHPDTKTYGFDNNGEEMPALWETSSSSYHSTDGYFGQTAPALRFMKDEDYLIIAYPETLLDAVSFWHADNGSGNIIRVESSMEEGDWSEVGNVTLAATGSVSEIRLAGVSAVRLVLEKKGGYAVIDDVSVKGRALDRTVVEGYDMARTGNTQTFSLSGLEAGETYSAVVTAVRGEQRSKTSGEVMVTIDASGIDEVAGPENVPFAYINLQGVRSKSPWSGMNIVVYKDGSVGKLMFK